MITQYTPGPCQVGHVHQNWTEIWGPDGADGSHEVLGTAIGPDQKANAVLWAAALKLLEACQAYVAHVETTDGVACNRDVWHMMKAAIAEADPQR